MMSNAEQCVVCKYAYPRARVQHRCDACRETIRPMDQYVRCDALFDGCWHHDVHCVRCHMLWTHLGERCSYSGPSWSWESPSWNLDCGESYRDVFDADPPEAVQAMAFWTPDEAQSHWAKYRRFDAVYASLQAATGARRLERYRVDRYLEVAA